MYLPSQFEAKREHAVELMREHPLASLISVDENGLPFVTHLPLHLEQRGEQLVLLGHCAKANVHWRYLQANSHSLVTFMGPQAYLSPTVYPDLARVPSWNYLAVHCVVEATLIETASDKEAVLYQLIADHESSYLTQWQASDNEFKQKMLAAIVGFELRVNSLQCKIKLNQHRPESLPEMFAQYARGTAEEQALAQWLVRLGLVER